MRKKEIRESTNQELIEWLLYTAYCRTTTKAMESTAATICAELEFRKVIDNATDVYKIWRQ